jgi:class 3 adenylate cyclase
MTAKIIDMTTPARLPAVILFAETRGFTRTSAMLQAVEVLNQAAAFFELVRSATERNGGTVHNVLNDTLMAFFTGPDRARQAVQAAQEIQRDFDAIEESWTRDFGIRAAVAMGLHAGDAVIGIAGRAPMMVIGDSISIATRLLHRARAGEFVISGAVIDAMGDDRSALEAEPLPPLEIPRRDPVPLFGVLRDARLDFT